VIHATALTFANQIDAAEARLERAEELVGHDTPEDSSRLVRGQVAQLRAIIARFSGDLALCVKLARQALELLPETEMLFRAGARLNVARAYQLSGDVGPHNERSASEVVLQTRASGSLFALVNSLTNLARLQRLQGRLRAAAATYQQIVRTVPGQQGLESLVGGAAYYVGLGDIHREWNDLAAAERLLMQGMDLMRGPLTIDADVVMEVHLSLPLVYQAQGRYVDALSCLEAFENLARQNGFPPPLTARAEAAHAHLALARGDLLAAVRWADASGLSVHGEIEYRRHEEYLVLARVLIAQGWSDPSGPYLDDALRLLERCLMMAQRGARTGSEVEILALQALGLLGRQDVHGALHALERALALAQPEGYVRIFADEGAPMAVLLCEMLKERGRRSRNPRWHALVAYARRLLVVIESSGTTAVTPVLSGAVPEQAQPLAEPLTKRELEVLRLIAEGLSNREIAARLFIATSTVKWHVNAVFRKLEADSRTRAVARARQAGLLSP
jgi:LuxR family maltose regulon positive regulatory protein